jgi:hypothetical protein
VHGNLLSLSLLGKLVICIQIKTGQQSDLRTCCLKWLWISSGVHDVSEMLQKFPWVKLLSFCLFVFCILLLYYVTFIIFFCIFLTEPSYGSWFVKRYTIYCVNQVYLYLVYCSMWTLTEMQNICVSCKVEWIDKFDGGYFCVIINHTE